MKLTLISFFVARYLAFSLRGPVPTSRRGALRRVSNLILSQIGKTFALNTILKHWRINENLISTTKRSKKRILQKWPQNTSTAIDQNLWAIEDFWPPSEKVITSAVKNTFMVHPFHCRFDQISCKIKILRSEESSSAECWFFWNKIILSFVFDRMI